MNDSRRGFVPWSFLAVNTTMPVSSPTKHSAILICCLPPSARPLWRTILESRTLTTRLWPWVPGRSCATLLKVGCRRALESAAIILIGRYECNNLIATQTCCKSPMTPGRLISRINHYLKRKQERRSGRRRLTFRRSWAPPCLAWLGSES
jgi:hypothetical protein